MNHKRPLLTFLTAILLSIAPPILLMIVLDPDGPLAIVLSYAVIVQISSFLSNRNSEKRINGWSITTIILFIAGAAVLFVQILITPLSAYLVWFRLVESMQTRGSVSFIFVSFTGYFAALLTSFFRRHGFVRPLLAYSTVMLFTGYIITRHWLFFLVLIPIFSLFLLLNVKSRYREAFYVRRAITTIIVVLLCVAFIALPISASIEPQGNRLVDKTVSPGLREWVVKVFPRFPLLYGIPGYGSSISEKQLGDPPVLSQRSVFRVSGPPGRTIYLRTAVFERFIGEGWYSEQEVTENAVPLDPTDDLVANERELARRPVVTQQEDALREADSIISVEVLADFHPTIPHTLKTTVIYADKRLDIEYGNRNTGYKLQRPLLYGDTVVLKEKEYTSPRIKPSETQADAQEKELQPFLKVPDTVSDEVRNLAAALKHDSTQATLTAIGSYLADEYRYTLDPEKREQGSAFLDTFLFDQKEGFCVHFATSFIVLARLNDIPARYATGYIVNIPSPDTYPGGMFYAEPSPVFQSGETGEEYIPPGTGNFAAMVTGYSSHAWPEVFVPEIGWIPYEATPPMRPEAYDDPDYWQRYFSDNQRYTIRQIQAITGNRVPEPEQEQRERPDIPVLPIALPIAALLTAAVIFISIKKNIHRYKGPKRLASLRRVGKGLLRHTGKKGIPHPSVSGWIAWENRVYGLLNGALGSYEMAIGDESTKPLATTGVPTHPGFPGEIFRKSFFGSYHPDEKDLNKLRNLKRELRKTRRSYMG